jgi:hypothetical protein
MGAEELNLSIRTSINISGLSNICASISPTSPSPKPLAEKLVFFMNLPVAPFYGMPPDKAAALKILLYQLTAGWCKVGYSTPMNVKLSKTPPFTNPPNVMRKFRADSDIGQLK